MENETVRQRSTVDYRTESSEMERQDTFFSNYIVNEQL
jgi:hypothetical protein